MKLGAFVAGLGTGYMAGENNRRQEEAGKRAERALKLQEDSAAITNQLQQEQLDQVRRQQATQRQLADLVDEFNGTKQAPTEQREDGPNPPPTRSDGDRIGFGLYRNPDLLSNSDFATRAGQIFLRAGMPEGIAWLERAGKAQKENAITALQHLVGGDTQAAADAFNKAGQHKVTGIEDLGGGKFRVGFNNGQNKEIDAQRALRSYLSPKDFFELAQKDPYYKAYADYLSGRNDASVTRATVAGDARVEAAGVAADGRVDAATIRATTGPRAGTAGTPAARGTGTSRAGSAEGGVLPDKWLSDFETNHLPQRDATDDKGQKRIDPKTGQTIQEVDEGRAPIVRDLARMNADVLARARVQPQEAGAVFGQFAKAFQEGDRAKAFSALDKGGRIVIATDNDGQPVRVLGRIGTASDRNPILFDLPEGMERMLLEQEFKNRETRAGERSDQAERARLRAGAPKKPPAVRGVSPQSSGPGTREVVGQIARPELAGVN